METMKFISKWFSSHCDQDWEHENQIKIETTSNPGWHIVIDLKDTPLEHLSLNVDLVEINSSDWYIYKVVNSQFVASGDLDKLEFLLNEFTKLLQRQK